MPNQFKEIQQTLIDSFPFKPTAGQAEAMEKLALFMCDPRKEALFILRGYAGTGKTTLIRSLVSTLPDLGMKSVLMAPTGKAAKVITQHSGNQAFTIHKVIYQPKNNAGRMQFKPRVNRKKNTVFIVDEASMISDRPMDALISRNSLLEDLLNFTSGGEGNKLILIGDTAQLPPVFFDESPALESSTMERWGRLVYMHELTQVMRQAQESGILRNATELRQMQVQSPEGQPQIETGPEVIRLTDGYEIEEALNKANSDGTDNVVVIVRSNKRANIYNRQIRSRVHWKSDRIATGDYLMIVRNNYYWLPGESKAGFLANGDAVEVLELRNPRELHGLTFMDARLRMPDFPDEEPFEAKIMLEVLDYDGPSLGRTESDALYRSVSADYADIPSRWKRSLAIKQDPYLNALQVKFAYAVTGHKAQGGQWKHVFIEQPWLTNGKVDLDYLRWLYTAFTRASETLYLIGFPDDYFPNHSN